MHYKKGRKRTFNKRNRVTVEQATEMAFNNLIKLRENKHIISVEDVLRNHGKSTEEINVIDRKFGGEKKSIEMSQEEPKKDDPMDFSKIVDSADVVVQVLDARDPMGSRCMSLEKSLNLKGRKLILLLNKSDLVPKENLRKWLSKLKEEYPTVVFKSSTQLPSKRLGRLGIKQNILGAKFTTSKCIGVDSLIKLLLESFLESQDICVGIVGLPNVGKKSVINSLKSGASCLAAIPDATIDLPVVNIHSKIKLIDCPGLTFAAVDFNNKMDVLNDSVNLDSLVNPVPVAEAILAKAGYEKLSVHYKIGENKDPSNFLNILAKCRGKVNDQDQPDVNAAAEILIKDWNCGKIKYYTEAPNDANGDIIPQEQLILDALPTPKIKYSICLSGPASDAMDIDSIDSMPGSVSVNI